MSPRLPIGRRWLRFCRSGFARGLRASGRGAGYSLMLLSAIVIFYRGIDIAYACYLSVGGRA